MSDDDSTESQAEAVAPDPVSAPAKSGAPEHSGVHIPGWLAGALVVVLALVVGGVGFAIGRTTANDDGGGFRPALARSARQGGPGGSQFPGGPGGQGGPRGQGGPGGQRGGQDQNGGGPQGGASQDGGSNSGGA